MKSLAVALVLFLVSSDLWAAACCVGNGPKSFVQLKHLQKYDLGVSTSFRDSYAQFDEYGELVDVAKNQAYSLSVGASGRLTEYLEIYSVIPWVYQVKEYSRRNEGAGNIGDAVLGFRYVVLENLFGDDWYPKIGFIPNVKMPTGTQDRIGDAGRVIPGTGNGLWEAGLAVQVQKDFGLAVVSFTPSYTHRFAKDIADPRSAKAMRLKEGDRIELGLSSIFPISQRFSMGAGGSAAWELARGVGGVDVDYSEARATAVFGSAQYFVSRFWTVSAAYEFSLPVSRLGKSQAAVRTISLTTNYAIY